MIVLNFVKKWFRLFCGGVSSFFLSACYSFSLGMEKLPNIPAPFQLKPCQSQVESNKSLHLDRDTWAFELRFVGSSPALSTARTLWGWHQRYVIPYTRRSLVFQLEVENKALDLLRLQPDQIRLHLPDGSYLLALALDDFKRAWPTEAVWSQETLLDRTAALTEVTRTLFSFRPILRGERRTGLVAFPRFELQTGEQLEFEISDPNQSEQIVSVCFQAF